MIQNVTSGAGVYVYNKGSRASVHHTTIEGCNQGLWAWNQGVISAAQCTLRNNKTDQFTSNGEGTILVDGVEPTCTTKDPGLRCVVNILCIRCVSCALACFWQQHSENHGCCSCAQVHHTTIERCEYGLWAWGEGVANAAQCTLRNNGTDQYTQGGQGTVHVE